MKYGEAVSLAKAIYNSKMQYLPDTLTTCSQSAMRQTNDTSNKLNKVEEQLKYKIYPNPSNVNSSITIEGKNICRIVMYNIKGEKLMDNSYNLIQKVSVVSNYPPGLYLIRLFDDKGRTFQQKIITE